MEKSHTIRREMGFKRHKNKDLSMLSNNCIERVTIKNVMLVL